MPCTPNGPIAKTNAISGYRSRSASPTLISATTADNTGFGPLSEPPMCGIGPAQISYCESNVNATAGPNSAAIRHRLSTTRHFRSGARICHRLRG